MEWYLVFRRMSGFHNCAEEANLSNYIIIIGSNMRSRKFPYRCFFCRHIVPTIGVVLDRVVVLKSWAHIVLEGIYVITE